MPKFFVPPEDIGDEELWIREDAHHLLHVLRQGPGDTVLVCDGEGTDYSCVIEAAEADGLCCRIEKREASAAEPSLRIALFQGIPKAEKLEWIIQKNTELGVDRVIPVETRRSVVHLEEKKRKGKEERWRKIAAAAAKQSGRGRIPKVAAVCSFSAMLRELPQYERAIVLYEDETGVSLKQCLSEWQKPQSVALLIGPEGGWDPEEIRQLKEAGAVTAGLGPRILRTETAGQTAVAAVLYHYDEM